MASIMTLNVRSFDAMVTLRRGTAVVEFRTAWCPGCRALAPAIERLARDHPELLVAEVDVDRCRRLARRFGIGSVPTVVRFDHGAPTAAIVGSLAYDGLLAALGLDRDATATSGDPPAA